MLSAQANALQSNHINGILKAAARPDLISFAGGLPHPSTFPVKAIQAAYDQVLDQEPIPALQYTNTQGNVELRHFIASHYRQTGLEINPEEIIITSGSQQAIELVSKLFVDPGDEVFIEDPAYLGALMALQPLQPRLIGIKLNKQGIDLDLFEALLKHHTPKLLYGVTNFNNPTGIQYSESNKIELARMLKHNEIIFIEDDAYHEIYFNQSPSTTVKSYAPEQTFLLGSFSKCISPGLRVGWICSPAKYVQKLVDLKQATDLHNNNLTQVMLSKLFQDFDYRTHLEEIRTTYRKNRDLLADAVSNIMQDLVSFQIPQGGLFIWAKYNLDIPAEQLLDVALKQNVAFVPGTAFAVKANYDHNMRINFSNIDLDRFEIGLQILKQILSQKN